MKNADTLYKKCPFHQDCTNNVAQYKLYATNVHKAGNTVNLKMNDQKKTVILQFL